MALSYTHGQARPDRAVAPRTARWCSRRWPAPTRAIRRRSRRRPGSARVRPALAGAGCAWRCSDFPEKPKVSAGARRRSPRPQAVLRDGGRAARAGQRSRTLPVRAGRVAHHRRRGGQRVRGADPHRAAPALLADRSHAKKSPADYLPKANAADYVRALRVRGEMQRALARLLRAVRPRARAEPAVRAAAGGRGLRRAVRRARPARRRRERSPASPPSRCRWASRMACPCRSSSWRRRSRRRGCSPRRRCSRPRTSAPPGAAAARRRAQVAAVAGVRGDAPMTPAGQDPGTVTLSRSVYVPIAAVGYAASMLLIGVALPVQAVLLGVTLPVRPEPRGGRPLPADRRRSLLTRTFPPWRLSVEGRFPGERAVRGGREPPVDARHPPALAPPAAR